MKAELTLKLRKLGEDLFDGDRFLNIENSEDDNEGIIIGVVDDGGDLTEGYFDVMKKKEAIALRDFLIFLYPK